MKNLMLIESPNKIKTIGKYLKGESFEIIATIGHIRELDEKKYKGMGFNEETFDAEWRNDSLKTYKGKKIDIIEKINAAAKDCREIYLSTDPDREGEAIAWHIYSILKEEYRKKCKRVVFNEITQDAISKALHCPRDLDQNQINSYLARKFLDRCLGFKLSSFVRWMAGGISAGRVQSIALKFLKDRDTDIKLFVPEHWFVVRIKLENGLELNMKKISEVHNFQMNEKVENGLVNFVSEEEVKEFQKTLNSVCELKEISEIKKKFISPPKALKTSSMHSSAINLFGISSSAVDSIAQKLYEGVEIDGEPVSLITYPRTDRVDLSETFVNEAKKFIFDKFGKKYWYGKRDLVSNGKSIVQGAHEAIRPTYINICPSQLEGKIDKKELNLYRLIWANSLASLMTDAISESVIYSFENNGNLFATSYVMEAFDGFRKILRECSLLEKFINNDFPSDLIVGNNYEIKDVNFSRVDKKPPSLYTEATLIKSLEVEGIGRPSTYSHIVNIVLNRNYAQKQSGKLLITDLGIKMADILEKYFPKIMKYDYTRNMEIELDNISENKSNWREFLKRIFMEFNKELEDANRSYLGKCEKCGSDLMSRFSRRTKSHFVGCSNYPECNFLKQAPGNENNKILDFSIEEKCPDCGNELLKRKNKWGKFFISCSGYPTCKYIRNCDEEEKESVGRCCPDCGNELLKRKNKWGKFFISCSGYPTCKYSEFLEEKEFLNENCPECQKALIKTRNKWNKFYVKCSSELCKFSRKWVEDEK